MFGLSPKTAWGFFAILVCFAGLVAFGNSVAPQTTPVSAEDAPLGMASAISNAAIGAPIEGAPETPAPMPQIAGVAMAAPDDGNLTKRLASIIGKSIVDRNPKGPQDGTFVLQDSQKMAREAADSAINGFDTASFLPVVGPGDILTDETTTENDYRMQIGQTIDAWKGGFSPPNPQTALPERLAAFARHYGDLADALRKIPVPPGLANEHEDALRSVLGRKKMLEVAAGYDTDPVYALVALKALKASP